SKDFGLDHLRQQGAFRALGRPLLLRAAVGRWTPTRFELHRGGIAFPFHPWKMVLPPGYAVAGATRHITQEVRFLRRLIGAVGRQLGKVVWIARLRWEHEPHRDRLAIGCGRGGEWKAVEDDNPSHVQRQSQDAGNDPSVAIRS